jgi:SAM-dependent methyltransferase
MIKAGNPEKARLRSLPPTASDTPPPSHGPPIITEEQEPAEFVDSLYRAILLREPDGGGRATHLRLLREGMSRVDLIKMFIASPEFKGKAKSRGFVPLGAPAMDVQCRASSSQLSSLVDRVSEAWTALGAVRPYHSVLTIKELFPENITEAAINRFWASGASEGSQIEAILLRHGFQSAASKTCLEYGCGLGRVTVALANIFKKVYAYDISIAHLEVAEKRSAQLGLDNIEFKLCGKDIFADNLLHRCDFFYSRIVLQHNPPPLMGKLISMALGSLQIDGVGIFQVPTYALKYRFNLDEYLECAEKPEMEMHAMPQTEIFDLVADAGCRILEVREDNGVGWNSWISNTFIVNRVV